MVGSLKMNTALEYSTRVVQERDRRCKKSTLTDLAYLTPLRIPLMNPVLVFFFHSKHRFNCTTVINIGTFSKKICMKKIMFVCVWRNSIIQTIFWLNCVLRPGEVKILKIFGLEIRKQCYQIINDDSHFSSFLLLFDGLQCAHSKSQVFKALWLIGRPDCHKRAVFAIHCICQR